MNTKLKIGLIWLALASVLAAVPIIHAQYEDINDGATNDLKMLMEQIEDGCAGVVIIRKLEHEDNPGKRIWTVGFTRREYIPGCESAK